MLKYYISRKLSRKITLIFLINIFVIISILFLISYKKSYNMLVHTSGDLASDICSRASENVNIDEYKGFISNEDLQKRSYKKLKEELSYIKEISGSRFIYIIRRNADGKYTYVLDVSDKPKDIGDSIDIYPGFEDVYKGIPYTSNKIEVDEDGALISSYFPLKENDGTVIGFVGVDYDAGKGYEALKDFRTTLSIVSLIILLIAASVAIFLSKSISKPIEKIAKTSTTVSNYDLTVEKINIKNKDELGVLANAFNIMLESISGLIKQISTSTGTLIEASDSLLEIAQNTSIATGEMSKAIEEISNYTYEQTKDVGDGTEKIKILAASIDQISSSVHNATNDMSTVSELNEKGIDTVSLLLDKSRQSSIAREDVERVIKTVDKSSEEIGVIIDTINKISAQTQLLSLNASIESARAGEYGKGFAVVAEEIKKLAEQSADSTENVRKLIEDIQLKSKEAVDSMNKASFIGMEQDEILKDTESIFASLSQKVNALSNDIYKIKVQNNDMNVKKDEIVILMNHILELAEENAASSEETSASTEELLSSINEFTNHANSLKYISETLESKVNHFKI